MNICKSKLFLNFYFPIFLKDRYYPGLWDICDADSLEITIYHVFDISYISNVRSESFFGQNTNKNLLAYFSSHL